MTTTPSPPPPGPIPSNLKAPGALRFWLAILFTGVGTGIGAIVLTRLLQIVQAFAWGGDGSDILDHARRAGAWKHVMILLAAGLITGAGQIILRQLSSANGIDTTAAIWFHAGRLPAIRTLGSSVLSVIIVGLGASLGREGAPKQAAAVIANFAANRWRLSDEERRLLVACGAGAGMAAAYGVPLGGAIFAIEVMRGVLALRFVLPALCVSFIATGVSWLGLPNAPTYHLPSFTTSPSILIWALLAGPLMGIVSVGYVRLITWADRHRPSGWRRLVAPIGGLGLLGVLSIHFPQLLGNGKDVSQLAFSSEVAPALFFALLFLKPAAIALCMRTGAPGGLFTPSLTTGAMLGSALGYLWTFLWPGAPLGMFAFLGAGALLAATTQGPISAVVLLMELTGRDRSFVLPLLIAVATATLVSRTIEPRSVYDAKLSDEELAARQRLRDRPLESNLS